MQHNQLNNLTNYFFESSKLTIFQNSVKTTFVNCDDKYELVLEALNLICKNSHEMPAFSVAEHKNTIDALGSGTWLELEFDTTKTYNEMPFDSLLIEVDSNFSGFNLIRKYNGKYDGRCFYLNLSSNMEYLFNTINKISKK